MGQVTQGAGPGGQVTKGAGPGGRAQLIGGAYGRPIFGTPGNRFTQPRMGPINPPIAQPPAPQPPSFGSNFGPQQYSPIARIPGTSPGRRPLPPNVSIGFGPAPLPQNPLTQQPPNWVTAPPEGSMNTQVITPITNPQTGEVYNAPTGGYGLNPSLFEPGVMEASPPMIYPPPFDFAQQQYQGPYTARPDLGPGRGFGVGLPAPRGPGSQFGAALGTSSPMLNTVGAGFNPRGAVGATSGY